MLTCSGRFRKVPSIPIWLGPSSRATGGYAFVHDPRTPVGRQTPVWLPEYSPGTLIIQQAPPGFAARVDLDFSALGAVVADQTDAEGREIVVADSSGALHIRLMERDAICRPAILLPLDDLAGLRVDVASRFVRRLFGERVNLLPLALQLTRHHKKRLIQLLQVFDIVKDGGGGRDVANLVLRSEQASLPSTEWKDSAARRMATRLIREAFAFVERKYLQFLRGG